MTARIEVTFHGVDVSPALRAAVEERAGRLPRLAEDIVSCHCVIEAQGRRQTHGNPYRVHVRVHLAGGALDTEGTGAEPYATANAALETMERRLRDFVRRRRDQPRRRSDPA
ncbi:MAG TPA: ribosome-associated translation inhibitor RaiA [Xanthomonadaceae bacterium]|nr:ribosome-associated translation inhibitor RaiA [Xanthomonadaceae bacterium]